MKNITDFEGLSYLTECCSISDEMKMNWMMGETPMIQSILLLLLHEHIWMELSQWCLPLMTATQAS